MVGTNHCQRRGDGYSSLHASWEGQRGTMDGVRWTVNRRGATRLGVRWAAAVGLAAATGCGGPTREQAAAGVAREFFEAVRRNRADTAGAILSPSATDKMLSLHITSGQMSKRETRQIQATARAEPPSQTPGDERYAARIIYQYREAFRGPNEPWRDGIMNLALQREGELLKVVAFDPLT